MEDDSKQEIQTAGLSREETLLKSASQGVDEVDDQPNRVVLPPAPQKKSHKKTFLALSLVLVVAIGAVLYLTLGKKSSTNSKTTDSTSTNTAAKKAVQTFLPNKVVYSYATSTADKLTVFSRPAGGGDRKEAVKLDTGETVNYSDVLGKVSAFTTGKKLYISNDDGATYKTAFEADATEDIIGVKISGSGNEVAFSTITPSSAGAVSKSVISSISTSGLNKQVITSSKDKALFIQAYNEVSKKLVYSEGCYACDGGRTAYKIFNLKTNKAQDLLPGVDVKTVQYGMQFSSDMKDLIYIKSTVDTKIPVDGLPGYYEGAPYSVMHVDVASGESKVIKTIGTKSEKNSNGTDKYRIFMLGFLSGTSTPYYGEGLEIFKVVDLKPVKIYESATEIKKILYVSDKNIIMSTEKTATDFDLINYDFTTKKPLLILEGDATTNIMGVTTK